MNDLVIYMDNKYAKTYILNQYSGSRIVSERILDTICFKLFDNQAILAKKKLLLGEKILVKNGYLSLERYN